MEMCPMIYNVVLAGNVFSSCSVHCIQGIQCSGIGCPGHSTVILRHPCLTQCACIVSCITIKRNEMTFVRQHLHTPGLSTTAPKHSPNAFKIESPIWQRLFRMCFERGVLYVTFPGGLFLSPVQLSIFYARDCQSKSARLPWQSRWEGGQKVPVAPLIQDKVHAMNPESTNESSQTRSWLHKTSWNNNFFLNKAMRLHFFYSCSRYTYAT